MMLASSGVLAQAWVQGGNGITSLTDYVGCDATSNQPLRLKTILNDPIYFYTGDINRMRLMDTITLLARISDPC